MKFVILLIYTLLIFNFFSIYATEVEEKEKILQDSLQIAHSPSEKLKFIVKLSQLNFPNAEKNLFYLEKGFDIVSYYHADNQKFELYFQSSIAYNKLSLYRNALSSIQEALKIAEKLTDKEKIANSWNQMGIVEYNLANYQTSTENYLKAIRYFEEIGNLHKVCDIYNNIGDMHKVQKSYDLAYEYFDKTHELALSLGDSAMIARVLNSKATNLMDKVQETNMADSVQVEFHYKQAWEFLQEAKGICIRNNLLFRLGKIYGNTGFYLKKREKHYEAIPFLRKSIEIKTLINDKQGIAHSLNEIGDNFMCLHQYDSAAFYSEKALEIIQEIGNKILEKNMCQTLANIYDGAKNYQKSSKYWKRAFDLQEQIFDDQRTQTINQLNTIFDVEKKDKELLLKTEENKITLLYSYFLAGSCFFVLILVIILYRNTTKKQKLYKRLEEKSHIIKEKNEELYHTNEELKTTLDIVGNQKITLTNQKSLIEQKHKDLEASIIYAKRIQEAILPSQKELSAYFNDFFVYYLPLNVVSGDFYWFADKNEVVILAVADCTGHGVPGAFMSMLGYELLNAIIHDKEIHSPELILNELQKGLMYALKQNDSIEITDGMDISIISLKKSSKNNSYEELLYAGANNPIFYIENRQLIEIKADRKSISNTKSSNFYRFTLHKIQIKTEIILYLSTDGFQDQFGGNNNKKFLAKRLKNLLLEHELLPCIEQRKIINQRFLDWKGEFEQTDDITLIGIRIRHF